MTDIDWSKAPAHATHWCPGNARIEWGWIYQSGGEFYSCYNLRGLEHIPDFPSWRKSRLVPRPAPWSGQGLPPVGAVCEIAASTAHLNIRHPEGTKVKVYATFTDDRGEDLAAFVDELGQVGGVATAKCFRTIRTAEQIAAEELEAEAEAMFAKFGGLGGLTKKQCLWVISEGYRKQVSP